MCVILGRENQYPIRQLIAWSEGVVSHAMEVAASYPLRDTEVGCKVGLWRAFGDCPPLNLLFHPLTLLCAYRISTSVVLISNSQPDASSVPLPEAQSWLLA